MFSFAGICSEEIKNFTANISRQNFNCSSSWRNAQQVRPTEMTNIISYISHSSWSVGPALSDQSDPVSPPSLFASLISGKNKSLEDLCWKVLSNEKDKRPYSTIEFAINTAILFISSSLKFKPTLEKKLFWCLHSKCLSF